MDFPDVKMGLKRCANLDEQLAVHNDVRAMRKAITFGRRDSTLINRCLTVAEYAGLSGDEMMTLLAYESLCMLEELFARELQRSMLDIRAPFFVKDSTENQS